MTSTENSSPNDEEPQPPPDPLKGLFRRGLDDDDWQD